MRVRRAENWTSRTPRVLREQEKNYLAKPPKANCRGKRTSRFIKVAVLCLWRNALGQGLEYSPWGHLRSVGSSRSLWGHSWLAYLMTEQKENQTTPEEWGDAGHVSGWWDFKKPPVVGIRSSNWQNTVGTPFTTNLHLFKLGWQSLKHVQLPWTPLALETVGSSECKVFTSFPNLRLWGPNRAHNLGPGLCLSHLCYTEVRAQLAACPTQPGELVYILWLSL